MKERLLPNQIAHLQEGNAHPAEQLNPSNPNAKPIENHPQPHGHHLDHVHHHAHRMSNENKATVITILWGMILSIGTGVAVLGEKHQQSNSQVYIAYRYLMLIPPLVIAVGGIKIRTGPRMIIPTILTALAIQIILTIANGLFYNSDNGFDWTITIVSLVISLIISIFDFAVFRDNKPGTM